MRYLIFFLLLTGCITSRIKKYEINESEWQVDPVKKVLFTRGAKGKISTLKLTDYMARDLVCIESTYLEDLLTFRDP